MNLVTVAFGCAVIVCLAAQSTTREPRETIVIQYVYSHFTHHLIVKKHNLSIKTSFSCTVAKLTDDEIAKVHTDAGMRSVEIRVLAQMVVAVQVTADTLNIHDVKECNHFPGVHSINGTLPGTLDYFTV